MNEYEIIKKRIKEIESTRRFIKDELNILMKEMDELQRKLKITPKTKIESQILDIFLSTGLPYYIDGRNDDTVIQSGHVFLMLGLGIKDIISIMYFDDNMVRRLDRLGFYISRVGSSSVWINKK